MKKYGKYGGLILVIYTLLFNAAAFLLPHMNTTNFWWTYTFTMIAFILQVVFAYLAFGKDTNIKEAYFGLPVAKYSFSYLQLQIIWTLICMYVEMPTYVAVLVSIFILGIFGTLIIRTLLASNIVVSVDDKIKTATFYIKSMVVDIEVLLAKVEDKEGIEKITTLLETVKYSDPMSNEVLADVERRISEKYNELKEAVERGNLKQIKVLCRQLDILFVERNKKCQLAK